MRAFTILLPCLLPLALAASPAAAAPAQAATPSYHQTGQLALGLPDAWDQLSYDATNHHVFVAHGWQLDVVDVSKPGAPKLAGTIKGFNGARSSTVVPGGFGYAAGYLDQDVFVFDRTSLKVVHRVPDAGISPDGLTYDAFTHNLFATNPEDGTVSVMNSKTDQLLTKIKIGGRLGSIAADGKGTVFAAQVKTGAVLRIDGTTNAVTATWKVGCAHVMAVAADPDHGRAFATCPNGAFFALDGRSGQVLATLSIGKGSDSLVYDPVRKRVLSANNDGTLSVVDAEGLKLLGNAKLVRGARTMALDPQSGRVFVATGDIEGEGPHTPGGAPRWIFASGTVKLLEFTPDK